MREKNAIKLGVLRMLKAAVTNATIEKGGADSKLTDAEAIQVIRPDMPGAVATVGKAGEHHSVWIDRVMARDVVDDGHA